MGVRVEVIVGEVFGLLASLDDVTALAEGTGAAGAEVNTGVTGADKGRGMTGANT